MNTVKKLVGGAIVSMLLATPALALNFAQFGQQNSARVLSLTNTGTGNAVSVTNAPVFFIVTEYGTPGVYNASFSMTGSTDQGAVLSGGQYTQTGWNGTMNFSNGSNYLTVDFVNATMGYNADGGSGALFSADPGNIINFSSSFLTLPDFVSSNFSLALTAIQPPSNFDANGYSSPFTASVAGSFAGEVPEPATWGMLMMGFGLVGSVMRRRQRGMATVTA
ncbi:PEPxxWA-CTERM sorting domain-containing protein [Polymorphobacter sp.]|uniref:PEPxxWA-CTERM sorting domain-containing protein n=1 Tax=Polymorphobacter sp. TaxID=1909290 RepID=UPI003F6F2E48